MLDFADRLLGWWGTSGRHDLPWQLDRTPYRVWVSEIMLQQTQVTTVVAYFNRFTARFPDLKSLAVASEEEVMGQWSGLGYYARARNLHRSARICLEQHDGQLPTDPDALHALPGIGRSTANAIIAQAYDQPAAILDGNVKRVLARHRLIEGVLSQSLTMNKLWKAAEDFTPNHSAADYTQAIMDLGATVCLRTKPHCQRCPVADDCLARFQGRVADLPTRKPRVKKKRIQMELLVIQNPSQQLLLQKRPPEGIWGGLWCLPSTEVVTLPNDTQLRAQSVTQIPPMEHLLTHRIVQITFDMVQLKQESEASSLASNASWFDLSASLNLGLPQPIRGVVEQLQKLQG